MLVSWRDVGAISTGDGQWSWRAPYGGEVVEVGGYISTLGGGSGDSTDYQLRNETNSNADILSTVGAFEVDSATNLLEGQVVNPNNAPFDASDVIDLDCDASTTGSEANAEIWAIVNLFLDDV